MPLQDSNATTENDETITRLAGSSGNFQDVDEVYGQNFALNSTITEDKKHLFDGKAFRLTIQYVLGVETVLHSFQTPDTSTRIHLRFVTYSNERTQILVYENPTVTTYNFSWTPRDRNRVTANTPASTVRAVTTASSNGTFLFVEPNFGDASNFANTQKHFTEMILAQNTEYLFGMQSYSTSNLTALHLLWYEV